MNKQYESVDLIGFSFEIEAYEKFYHRHIIDVGVGVYALLSR
jgi:hypothetical protein